MQQFKKPTILVGAAIAIVYILLRFWGLTDSCLWFDEIFGVHAAEHGWMDMFWFVAQDLIHPPLFYVLLKLWIAAGGDNVFWLRSFAVFFSVLSIAPFLLLCKELKLTATTVLVAFGFFAVNGSLIKYAQEVRMYSLLLFLSLVSTWLFARFFYRGKNIWLLTLVNVLLVYTHYFGWFVVGSELAAILILQRTKVRHVLIMFAVTFASFVPWIWTVGQAASTGASVEQNIGWIAKPGFAAVFEFAFDVIEPFYFQQSSISPSSNFLITIPLIILIAAAKIHFLAKFRLHQDNRTLFLLAAFAVAPVVFAAAASWLLPFSIWGSRHLIIVFPAMAILIGLCIDAIEIRELKMAAFALIAMLFVFGFVFRLNEERPSYIWCAWERLAQDIPQDSPQTLYVFEDLVAYHMWFATRKSGNVSVQKVEGVPAMQEDKAYFLPRGFNEVRRITPDYMSGEKFWVAFRDMQFNEKHPPMSVLGARGYTPKALKMIDSGGLKAILVEAAK